MFVKETNMTDLAYSAFRAAPLVLRSGARPDRFNYFVFALAAVLLTVAALAPDAITFGP